MLRFFQIERLSEHKERKHPNQHEDKEPLERKDSNQHEDLGQNVDSERHEESNNKEKYPVHDLQGLHQNRTLCIVLNAHKPPQEDSIDQH